jgi:hypothetical protein
MIFEEKYHFFRNFVSNGMAWNDMRYACQYFWVRLANNVVANHF